MELSGRQCCHGIVTNTIFSALMGFHCNQVFVLHLLSHVLLLNVLMLTVSHFLCSLMSFHCQQIKVLLTYLLT